MTPRRLADLRQRALAAQADGADVVVDVDTLVTLLDSVDDLGRAERALRAELDRAGRRVEEAEATATLLREELEEVTAGWFDSVREVEFAPPAGRPLLRAIEGGAGS